MVLDPRGGQGARVVIPRAPPRDTTVRLLVALDTVGAPASPVLEEEGCPSHFSLGLNVRNPFLAQGTRLVTRLTTEAHLVNITKVDGAQVFWQWFNGENRMRSSTWRK